MTLDATLTNATNGTPIAEEPVQFIINGSTVCTTSTDSNGVATCGSATNAGPYGSATLGMGYEAVFPGSGLYLGSSASAGLVG